MKSLYFLLCFFIIFIVIMGCVNKSIYMHDDVMTQYPKKFEYIQFLAGKEIERYFIDADSEIYKKLNQLMLNKEGWSRTYITYAPNHMFVSPRMEINVLDTSIVINFERDNAQWIQIDKVFDKNDILNIFGKEWDVHQKHKLKKK